jgi:hypothetical protein
MSTRALLRVRTTHRVCIYDQFNKKNIHSAIHRFFCYNISYICKAYMGEYTIKYVIMWPDLNYVVRSVPGSPLEHVHMHEPSIEPE